MAITESQYFLECLAWRASAEIRSGRWLVSGRSCGQTVISIADTEEEAWSAACSMAHVTAPAYGNAVRGVHRAEGVDQPGVGLLAYDCLEEEPI